MHKFKVDLSIIEDFLNYKSLSKYYENDIYMVNNESIFIMPINTHYERIRFLKEKAEELLKRFRLKDQNKYYSFIKNPDDFESKIIIKLVVGMPNNITKLFRMTESDEIIILLDIANYSKVMSDTLEIIEDISDYVGYAVTLMVIDASSQIDSSQPLNLFEHALYSTSFAAYISESNQLNFMRNLDSLDIWVFLEFDTIKQIFEKKKKANRYASEYMDMVLTSNPEMIALGVTGKLYLENKNFDEAKNMYLEGPKKFLNHVYGQSDLLFITRLTKSLSFIKNLILPLTIVWLITCSVVLITNKLNLPFKIIPLIIMNLLIIKDSLRYKLMYLNSGFYILRIIIYLISCLIFLFIV